MNRRIFTLGFGTIASSMMLPTFGLAQDTSLSDAAEESWRSDQEELVVAWNSSLFEAPSEPHGGDTETLILKAKGPRNLFTAWVMLLEGSLTTPDEMLDYVENDTDLMYGLSGTVNERTVVAVNDDSFGVLYRPIFGGKADTWSYEEFLSLPETPRKAVQLWLNGNRSVFDRSAIDAAISSVSINEESMLQAIELDELLDHIEAMQVIIP